MNNRDKNRKSFFPATRGLALAITDTMIGRIAGRRNPFYISPISRSENRVTAEVDGGGAGMRVMVPSASDIITA
jgi:hypothetical protein